MTRLTFARAHDFNTFNTPLIAGLIMSFSGSSEAKFTGVASWMTRSEPAMGVSKSFSTVSSPPNIFSSPKLCSARR
uniref:Uncharacterized protein n=1 Tax=Lotus japonicus TaxID=34305 RepID=I3S956_LOTJA|nr:unknown [Lotus japonicus]